MNKATPKKNPVSLVLPREPIVPSVPVPQQPKLSIEQAMHIAERHQAAGELQKAEGVLRQILNLAPEHPFALHLLGVVAQGAGKTDIAIDLISKAISINGNIPLFHANIGEMYRRSGQLDLAVKHGQKAVSLDPKMLSAHGNLGIAYYDQEEYEKAEQCHRAALAINPDFAPSLNNIGSILRQQNKYTEAADYFRAAIKANPDYLDSQNNLGEILTRLEQPEEALKVLDAVLKRNPRYDSAHCNMGLAFLALGNEQQATNAFLRALKINPVYAPAHAGMVLVFLEFHRLEEGERAARRLIELEPNKADSHSMLGSILLAQGLAKDAQAAFKKALELDEDYVPAKAGIGHVLMEEGDLEGAEVLFRSCMKEEGETSPALYSLVQVKKIKEGDPEIALLEKEAKRLEGKLVDSKAIPLNFALGKMYDDLGQYDKGFPYYIEGCRLKRKSFTYSMEEKEKNIARTKAIFTKELIAKNTGKGDPSALPIFVLGMPRSGTTLTEQIIASHPSVYGAGELRDLINVVESGGTSFHDKMNALQDGTLAAMGRQYAEGLRKYSADALKITDKMPGNFHYVGLIHLMLPNAKIVHVQRHPLDTCLSCFTRLFAHGQANTYDLAEIGHFYKCYKGLMDHWQEVLPAGSFYNIKYESLVDDTEGEARKLIDYCGLDWDETCLEFYKNKRNVRTASVTQVRQPIYKTSKQRWKNYEKFLGPMIDALGDAFEKDA